MGPLVTIDMSVVFLCHERELLENNSIGNCALDSWLIWTFMGI